MSALNDRHRDSASVAINDIPRMVLECSF